MSNGNPFYVKPADYSIGLPGLAEAIGKDKEIKAQQAELDRIETMKAGAVEAYRTGNPDTIAEFSLANPEMSQAMLQASQFRSKRTEDNYADSLFDFYQNPTADNVNDLVQSRQELLRDEGVAPEMSQETDSFIERFTQDPEGVQKDIGMELAFRYPAKWKAMQAAVGGDKTGDVKNFEHYQRLQRESPDQAAKFAEQTGITKRKPDDRTTAIKEFEYGEKNPKFKLQQVAKVDAEMSKAARGKRFETTTKLRKEFVEQSKDYQKVRDAYTRVIQSTQTPSPAGDLALIFNYMKMLDPGSVVRESEFATAASAGSYGERIQAAVQKVLSGERLSPAMRGDFLNKSGELFSGMEDQHSKRSDTYKSIAEKNNLPVDEVVVDITRPEEEKTELPEGVTEADISFTMEKHGLTREQVLTRLK